MLVLPYFFCGCVEFDLKMSFELVGAVIVEVARRLRFGERAGDANTKIVHLVSRPDRVVRIVAVSCDGVHNAGSSSSRGESVVHDRRRFKAKIVKRIALTISGSSGGGGDGNMRRAVHGFSVFSF